MVIVLEPDLIISPSVTPFASETLFAVISKSFAIAYSTAPPFSVIVSEAFSSDGADSFAKVNLPPPLIFMPPV